MLPISDRAFHRWMAGLVLVATVLAAAMIVLLLVSLGDIAGSSDLARLAD